MVQELVWPDVLYSPVMEYKILLKVILIASAWPYHRQNQVVRACHDFFPATGAGYSYHWRIMFGSYSRVTSMGLGSCLSCGESCYETIPNIALAESHLSLEPQPWANRAAALFMKRGISMIFSMAM